MAAVLSEGHKCGLVCCFNATDFVWKECDEERQGLNERNRNDAVGDGKGIIRP